jgi:ACS family pantothenate transporter-like MFS transporter
MSWANEICGADAEERAVVIGVMNSMGYAFNAWIPLLTYPQKDSPKFKKGFIYSTCAFAAQGLITAAVAFMYKRDLKKTTKAEAGDEEEANDAILVGATRTTDL